MKIESGGKIYAREVRAGEGFAAQNSKTIVIGIGEGTTPELSVSWPSGKVSKYGQVETGNLITCFENAAETKDDSGVQISPYANANFQPSSRPLAGPESFGPKKDKPTIYISMATWCPACKASQPQVRILEEQLGGQVNLVAIPIDLTDDKAKLDKYIAEIKPAYTIQADRDEATIDQMKTIVLSRLEKGDLPSSLFTNADGKVIAAYNGVPDLSAIRNLLRKLKE